MDMYVDAYGLTRLRVSVVAHGALARPGDRADHGGRSVGRPLAAARRRGECRGRCAGLRAALARRAHRRAQRPALPGDREVRPGVRAGLSADAAPALDELPEPHALLCPGGHRDGLGAERGSLVRHEPGGVAGPADPRGRAREGRLAGLRAARAGNLVPLTCGTSVPSVRGAAAGRSRADAGPPASRRPASAARQPPAGPGGLGRAGQRLQVALADPDHQHGGDQGEHGHGDRRDESRRDALGQHLVSPGRRAARRSWRTPPSAPATRSP